jgi:uncharacterized protein YeaO (DUF488 family)
LHGSYPSLRSFWSGCIRLRPDLRRDFRPTRASAERPLELASALDQQTACSTSSRPAQGLKPEDGWMHNPIKLKRVYEPPLPADGTRFLVERLWPRGMRKADLPLNAWLKTVAPSAELRRWFAHDPTRWDEFRSRYSAELDAAPGAWQPILQAVQVGAVTLLFSAHDLQHNNAVALKEYLDARRAQPDTSEQPG